MPPLKKLLIIAASPRPKSNSAILADEAARGAEEAGAEVKVVRLSGLAIGPCLACDGCRKAGAKGCVQKDGLTALHPDVLAADALLIATPVYWFTMSGQAKMFMDRLYAFGARGYRGLKGKRVGLIMTYADATPRSSGALNALKSFEDAFAYVGAPIAGTVFGSAGEAGAIRMNKAVLKKAYALGRVLAS
jgi:multimeric flavodoxin WrbA